MKESLRAIFAGDLAIDEVDEMLDHWSQRGRARDYLVSSDCQRPSVLIEMGSSPPSDWGSPTAESRGSTPRFAPSLQGPMGFTPPKPPCPW